MQVIVTSVDLKRKNDSQASVPSAICSYVEGYQVPAVPIQLHHVLPNPVLSIIKIPPLCPCDTIYQTVWECCVCATQHQFDSSKVLSWLHLSQTCIHVPMRVCNLAYGKQPIGT